METKGLSTHTVSKIAHTPWSYRCSRLEIGAALKLLRGLCVVQFTCSLRQGLEAGVIIDVGLSPSGKSWVVQGMPSARTLRPLTGIFPEIQGCRNPGQLAHSVSKHQSPAALWGWIPPHFSSRGETSGMKGVGGLRGRGWVE